MCLRSILPIEEIEHLLGLPLRLQEHSLADIWDLIKTNPTLVHSASLRIWDRVVTCSDNQVDPMMLADHVNDVDPWMFNEISRIIGENSIKDMYFIRAEVEDETLAYRTAAQLAAAHTFPNDLLLVDLLLSNPYRSIPPDGRVNNLQKYRGYGLLGTVIENAVECGHLLGCDDLIITAASIELAPLFERCGFLIDETPSGRNAILYQLGPPMNRPL